MSPCLAHPTTQPCACLPPVPPPTPTVLQSFAHVIYYTIIKICFNQIRFLWTPEGYPPRASSRRCQPLRLQEGEAVLQALGDMKLLRRARLQIPADRAMWQQHAIHVYRDMIVQGFKPLYSMLDI